MFIYFIIVITVTEENNRGVITVTEAAIIFAWGRNEEAVRMQISLHLSRKQMQSKFYIKEYRYNVYSHRVVVTQRTTKNLTREAISHGNHRRAHIKKGQRKKCLCTFDPLYCCNTESINMPLVS